MSPTQTLEVTKRSNTYTQASCHCYLHDDNDNNNVYIKRTGTYFETQSNFVAFVH